MTKLIVGCGYLGLRVARRWRDAGETVYAVTRHADRADRLADEGLRPIVADVTTPDTLAGLPSANTVLYCVAFDPSSGQSRQAVYGDGLAAVLARMAGRVGKIVLASSTGVYGPSLGQWIDEATPCHPPREAGQAMLAAEQVLQSHSLASRGIVLRLAGLYGPGRIPKVADLLAWRPIVVAEGGYLNLVHVDDAASAVVAADAHGVPPRTYLVADGHPVLRGDFYRCLAELLQLPPPTLVEPAADQRAVVRGTADKRIRNTRMLEELQVSLQYPSYREGLAAVVRLL